jgi:hypothetical protein
MSVMTLIINNFRNLLKTNFLNELNETTHHFIRQHFADDFVRTIGSASRHH